MKYLIALGLVATLTACSGSGNHASKRELAKAIDEFNSSHPLCVPVNDALAGQAGNTAHLIKGRFGDEWIHVTTENLAGAIIFYLFSGQSAATLSFFPP